MQRDAARKTMIGSGDRSQRVRTYNNMPADHADIGHWSDDDAGTGLTGYDAMNMVLNGAGGTFIDPDPDRFVVRVVAPPANANPILQDTIELAISTLMPDGAEDDNPTTIRLTESRNVTADFRSEALLLMSPDLPIADNPDDVFPAFTFNVNPYATVMDDASHDRTHRASIDGRVQMSYTALGGTFRSNWPVCDRVPADQRRTVRFRTTVFYEPHQDVGPDGMPGTMDAGEGNGMYDIGEPHTEISGDGVWNTVLGPIAGVAGIVTSEVERSQIAWAQACIKFEQVGAITYRAAPRIAGANIFTDGLFDFDPGADDVAIIRSTAGATPDVAEVYFVAPMLGATGYTRAPANMGGALPGGLGENTYLFVAAGADIRRRTLAHELGHGLTNQPDSLTPVYIYFPSDDLVTLDTSADHQRRITHDTETDARTCRPPGVLGAAGNRLLPGCP